MYLNQFHSSDAARLQQILATLKTVHGVHVKIDVDSPTAEFTIKECQLAWTEKRDRVISESTFNSYQQNPEYIKSMLILEAMNILLIEIAPKRRRARKMHESENMSTSFNSQPIESTDESADAEPNQTAKIVALGNAIKDYASKQHGESSKDVSMFKSFARVGDKLVNMGTALGNSGLSNTEQKIVRLAQLKMKADNQLDNGLDEDLAIMTATPTNTANPGMDNVHESDILAESDTLSSVNPMVEPNLPGKATFSQAHHYEYQASMARSELYRNAKYAMSMLKQIDPNEEIQPWIAACLTKSANMLDKVFHYLDYYKTFEPDQLPEDIDGDMELGETSGSVARENLMLIIEYSTNLFNMIKPGDKLEGWVAMKLTTASESLSSSKHYMDYVQFEHHALDDHFDEARKAKRHAIAEARLLEDAGPNAEELAKATLILNAKSIANKVQDMAEDTAKLGVNDLMPLVDSLRTQYGPESATGFNDAVKAALNNLLTVTTETKETIDAAITTLQGGGVPSTSTDIEQPTDELPTDTTGIDADSATPDMTAATEEPEEPIDNVLGRAKKPVAEGIFSKKSKASVTQISPPTTSQMQKANASPLKKGQVDVTQITNPTAGKELDVPAVTRRGANPDGKINEVAPPGKKAEEFITSNKADFKKRYGSKWEQVLYATAWKKFGAKNEGYAYAVSALADAKAQFALLMNEMAAHKIVFKKLISEGIASDPLCIGYGLEGENIRLRLINAQRKIAEQTSVVRQIMQEGVIGMIKSIELLNKNVALEDIKNKTPYGVIYNTPSGRKSKKMFESVETRAYWLELRGNTIANTRMIEPTTFDLVINKKTKV